MTSSKPQNQLLIADIAHTRYKTRHHALNYTVYYLCFDLEEMSAMDSLLLGVNRFSLYSLLERDHTTPLPTKKPVQMKQWICDVLKQFKVKHADGKIVLLTMPRLMGYAFNPVSFWFCFSKKGELQAVLSEVNNTFGERHCYLSFHDDGRAITQNDWLESRKVFHVSPFFPIEGFYRFRFAYGEEKLGVWIDYWKHENGQDVKWLSTSLVGKRSRLSDIKLAWVFVRYPFVTFKVITMIHWHAIKLMLKKIRYIRKPEPPKDWITR